MSPTRRLGAAAAIAAGALALASSARADRSPREYRVTITGLLSGQPFTPPLVATHRGDDVVFEVGERASFGITVQTQAYDSHTEVNTEHLGDIVPSCQGLIGVTSALGLPGTDQSDPVLREDGVIRPPRGHHRPSRPAARDPRLGHHQARRRDHGRGHRLTPARGGGHARR